MNEIHHQIFQPQESAPERTAKVQMRLRIPSPSVNASIWVELVSARSPSNKLPDARLPWGGGDNMEPSA